EDGQDIGPGVQPELRIERAIGIQVACHACHQYQRQQVIERQADYQQNQGDDGYRQQLSEEQLQASYAARKQDANRPQLVFQANHASGYNQQIDAAEDAQNGKANRQYVIEEMQR